MAKTIVVQSDTFGEAWTKQNVMNTELYSSQLLNNFTATVNPTADDDSTEGYSVGSFWVNTSPPGVGFICTDATEGDAHWTNGVSFMKEENVSAMRKGTVVMITGESGGRTLIGIVDPTDPARFRGLAVAAESISQNGNGFMQHTGEIILDTRHSVGGINADAVDWVVGDDLYVTADATGRWSKFRPAYGRIIRVGKAKTSSGVTGGAYVNVKENIIRNMCAATESAYVQLGDSIGGTSWNVQNYAGDTVASIDSDGNLTLAGFTASEFASMYFNANSTATTIETADTPIGLRLFTAGSLEDWIFNAGSTAAITVYADYSGTVAGTILATSTHGLTTGDFITIRGTTNYNGVFEVTVVDSTHFYFTDTWVADDGASDFDQASYLEAGANSLGTYSVDWAISTAEGGGAGSTVLYTPYKNTTIISQARNERKFANNDVGSISGGGDITIAAGDRIYITVKSTGTNTITNSYGSVRLQRL